MGLFSEFSYDLGLGCPYIHSCSPQCKNIARFLNEIQMEWYHFYSQLEPCLSQSCQKCKALEEQSGVLERSSCSDCGFIRMVNVLQRSLGTSVMFVPSGRNFQRRIDWRVKKLLEHTSCVAWRFQSSYINSPTAYWAHQVLGTSTRFEMPSYNRVV